MTSRAERTAWWLVVLALAAGVSWKLSSESGAIAQAFRGVRPAAAPAPASEGLPGSPEPLLAGHRVAPGRRVRYSSWPPTSGRYLARPVALGVHARPLAPELQVDALAHGHVILQYASSFAGAASLGRFAREFPDDVIVAPGVRLRAPIVLTAWGRLERLHRASRPAIVRFITVLRNRYDGGWSG
jgi:hypothetical protein